MLQTCKCASDMRICVTYIVVQNGVQKSANEPLMQNLHILIGYSCLDYVVTFTLSEKWERGIIKPLYDKEVHTKCRPAKKASQSVYLSSILILALQATEEGCFTCTCISIRYTCTVHIKSYEMQLYTTMTEKFN